MTMAHDLLTEPLLSWRDIQRHRLRSTLPGILARIASGELSDFPRLRTHHFHPWCMFLTQLAAVALQRVGASDPRLPEEAWTDLLLNLTDKCHEPWSLIVNELSSPAFLQPPVPEGSISSWSISEYPDDRDVIVTAKGHDVKSALMRADEPETWVYALTTLQTTQGYPGRGYHGIARMNGGYGNRPRIGLAPDHSVTSRFLRDVHVMLDAWPDLVQRGYRNDGLGLSWTEPWDGRSTLGMAALTPHFIEVCGRVRCVQHGKSIRCAYRTTQTRRCLSAIDGGDVGDPWIPVERTGTALTVGPQGFHYKLLTDLVFEGEFAPAAAQIIRGTDPDPLLFLTAALARGQGKTEGLHERALTLAGQARPKMGRPDTRATIGLRAKSRVVAAATMRLKVLLPALHQLAGRGDPMRDRFDAQVDDIFFEHLFGSLDLCDDDARVLFERELVRLARAELDRAVARSPVACSRKFRAISEAEFKFQACLYRHFPDVASTKPREDGDRT